LQINNARSDETETAARNRLNDFKVNTLRMLKQYEDKNKLKVVRAKPKVRPAVAHKQPTF
jgi:adenylate kinase family enzyme